MILLNEDKTRFVNKAFNAVGNNTDGELYTSLVKFVNTNAVDKFKINWQENPKKLYDDITGAYNEYIKNGGSKSYKKQNPNKLFESAPLSVIHEGTETDYQDLIILDSLENENFIFVTPLTYKACVWLDSFECGGQGAKWCLGYVEDDVYWKDHIDDGDLFVMAFSKEEYRNPSGGYDENGCNDKLKYMIELGIDPYLTQIWKQSDREGETLFGYEATHLIGHSFDELAQAVVYAVGADDNKYTMGPNWDFWGNKYEDIISTPNEQIKWYDDFTNNGLIINLSTSKTISGIKDLIHNYSINSTSKIKTITLDCNDIDHFDIDGDNIISANSLTKNPEFNLISLISHIIDDKYQYNIICRTMETYCVKLDILSTIDSNTIKNNIKCIKFIYCFINNLKLTKKFIDLAKDNLDIIVPMEEEDGSSDLTNLIISDYDNPSELKNIITSSFIDGISVNNKIIAYNTKNEKINIHTIMNESTYYNNNNIYQKIYKLALIKRNYLNFKR